MNLILPDSCFVECPLSVQQESCSCPYQIMQFLLQAPQAKLNTMAQVLDFQVQISQTQLSMKALLSQGHLHIDTSLLILEGCENVCACHNAHQLSTAVNNRDSVDLQSAGKHQTPMPGKNISPSYNCKIQIAHFDACRIQKGSEPFCPKGCRLGCNECFFYFRFQCALLRLK